MSNSPITPEMAQWLHENRDAYETYLLHALLHDPMRRRSLMATPLTHEDFKTEARGLVVAALGDMMMIADAIGIELQCPPTLETMSTYIDTAANRLSAEDDVRREARALVKGLQDPALEEQHYCVSPYFVAWYGSIHAKRVARQVQLAALPDAENSVRVLQKALDTAHAAVQSLEVDGMDDVIYGEDEEQLRRRATGIVGLDSALNGGWGDAECYLIFGGTGSGKSILAGQCGWHELAVNNGDTLVVSTELFPREYVVRMVSCAAGVPINYLQDCMNFKQIRQAVARNTSLSYKLPEVEETLALIADRLRVAKVAADDGLSARHLFEREVQRYEKIKGRTPSLIFLDWLGTVADVQDTGKNGNAERIAAWERSASSCVKFAEVSGIPTVVLAQAVNNSQTKKFLTLEDIGIAKGIGKNMVTIVGVTNTADMEGLKAAAAGKADLPSQMFKRDQFFCVCKARKGEGLPIPVTREFRYQKFVERVTNKS